MSRNSDLKAIGWYAKTNDYRPEISPWPIIWFTRRQDGKRITIHVDTIVALYARWREEERKLLARRRKEDT